MDYWIDGVFAKVLNFRKVFLFNSLGKISK